MTTAKERVMDELVALQQKLNSLEAFLKTAAFRKLSIKMQDLMQTQFACMADYEICLQKRLEIWDDV